MLKLLIKIFTVLIISLTLVHAGSMGPVCLDKPITIPCMYNAWDFDAQALYLKSAYTGEVINNPISSIDFVFRKANANPAWGAGFKIEGAYHFNNGHDLTTNWYYYSKTTNDGFINVQPKWTAVNVEFGQHIDVSSSQDLRLYGGIHFLRLDRRLIFPALISNKLSSILHVAAVGGKIGADFAFKLPLGFAIYSKGGGALLAGANKSRNFQNRQILNLASYDALIPELEIKLGLKYTYDLAENNVIIDGGFMWLNYFNAFYEITPIINPTRLTESNYGLYGPYVGIKFVGNI